MREPGLQGVLAVEHQHRGLRQRLRVHALREMALVKGRRAGSHVAHAAQRMDPAALDRLRQRGHGAQHRPVAQQGGGMVLVFRLQVQRSAGARRELHGRLHEPGFQAVVVDRHGNAGVGHVVIRHAQPVQRVVLQQRGLLGQPNQHLAVGRGRRRHRALHQQAAHAVFQRLDPLRHGGRGDVERQRRPLETALAHYRSQGPQVPVIDLHEISFT
ncbi:hypothetical protein D9M68_696940 [compost metagenome]